ncbi:NAD(P)/FAD-dependent oxidoreductase [Lachnospiraceae bacterium TF09-5]|nr:NAD(P)/FAD-dependent oxidoreductase [Lachnospiraceae bacterium TF09-5]
MSRVLVVGGGAAGMMAALAAAGKGHRVTLFEKNEKLGKKIYITGKGRCNVTNACEPQELFDNVVSNSKFLYSAFYGFDNNAVQQFFETHGCPLKTERGNRVFPVSDHSSDVIRALSGALEKAGVEIRLHTPVKKLLTEKAGEEGSLRIKGVKLLSGEEAKGDAVVLACGGLSYQATGSTGDGYRMAQETGHTLVSCKPSLVPFHIKEEWCRQLQGLALKNVNASLYIEGKEIYEGFGEMLFTHFGVSGPLILSASSYYQTAAEKLRRKKEKQAGKTGKTAENMGREAPALLKLDLKPALSSEQLDKRILRDFEDNKNKQFKNAVDGLFPARLVPVMIQLSGINPEKKVHEITREERKFFIECIKGLTLTVTGTRGFEEAIITRGGIKVKEVNPSTMESKLVSGLYLAGEMLDLDALTGGFNLQIAWSTGHLAGASIP